MDDIAIKVEHVFKKYCKFLRRSMWYGLKDIIKNSLGFSAHSERLRKDEFWALDDISFEVKKGETFGVIGPNGSGKTTLLKLLNGIFWPDKGKITVKGRVGALIEIGAGFHPVLTGRDNIYINAAILGMKKKEVDDKFDDIVEFADIGNYIDTPVKYYSSGMFIRLGFSVAIHCELAILLVDEVLAVGDKDFQIKCLQKMHEIKKRGTTIILISHNEYAIREQTEKCLYLNKGKIKFLGSTEDALSLYIRDTYENKMLKSRVEEKREINLIKKGNILSLKFFDSNWNEISYIESGQELNIVVECNLREKLNNPIFGVNFYDNQGFLYCANSYYENVTFEDLPLGAIQVKIKIPEFHLPTKNYACSVVIAEENVENLVDWHDQIYKLTVGRARNSRGAIKLQTQWAVEKIE